VYIGIFGAILLFRGSCNIDGKSLWRYPHVSAIFAEVNATVKSGGCPARTKNATFPGSPSMNLASIFHVLVFVIRYPFSII
jgi:hypothetical protein